MGRYLNPKSDLVFKKIFGEHPKLLKSFLNAFLPLSPDRQVEHIDYLPTENVPEIPGYKSTIVDVRCRDTLGRHFIVEMQLRWSEHFMRRMLFNSASAYVRQLKRGENYDKLCPVYGLSIVDGVFSDESEWFHHYQLTNTKNATKTMDEIQLIFLELPKFKPATINEKKLTVLWLRFLTEINEDTGIVDPALFTIPEISKALEYAEIAAYSSQELLAYERHWDAISSEKTLLTDNYRAGETKGKAEGKAEGIEKIVKNLLSKGWEPEFIVENANIDLAVVKKIQAELR